ncbi:MAG: hypothetical protein ACE5GJ_01670 [Gemmatimonadota bacterium]
MARKNGKTEEKIRAAVEAEIKRNPSATVDQLWEVAKSISPAVGRLTKRQFHARYPLQIKRKLAPPRKRKARKTSGRRRAAPAKPTAVRDEVRAVFLKFASDLAAAETRKDVVKVVAGVDRYVDQALAATGKG